MNPQEEIDELRARIARLERRPRRFNQQEAAAELNMSVSKLRQERKAGRINGKRHGRVWTFTNTDIEAYLATSFEDEPA
jgi:helix-turn-helix protein